MMISGATARVLPEIPPGDAQLLARVAREASIIGCDEMSHQTLSDSEITLESGVDHETAFLYHRTLNSPENRGLAEDLENLPPEPDMIRGRLPKVFIAPAAFYKEYPQFGGDGLIVRDAADKLGMECGTIPTRSTGGLDVNAEIIGRTLADQDGDGFILVTLSKGGADARIAFEQGHIPQGKVAAWLQIGGLIHGTPLATHLLQGGWWRRALLTGYLAYTSASRELVSDLVSGEGSRLSRRAMAPDGVTVINMVGFPLARHLSGNLRSRHSRLAEFGPNDGCTLIRDAIVEPGLVLPIWGANHYFQHPVMPRCALALLKYLRIRLSADNSSGSSFNPPIHPRRECEA